MEKRKLLISEGNAEFSAMLVRHLQGAYQVRTTEEGQQTLDMILSYHPDILVLDLMLPGLDGISILQAASAAGERPMVLAVTKFASDYVLDTLGRMGVGYLMMKPCDVKAMVNRIADLSQRLRAPVLSHPDPRTSASNLVLNLGVRTKLKGYVYLREAIPLAMKNPGISLTKELYPEVGKIYGVNAIQVERAIRGAVNSAWQQRDEQVWRMYFQAESNGTVPRPTNGAFITRLADCLLTGVGGEDTLQEM